MARRPVLTITFQKCLNDLLTQGAVGRRVRAKTCEALHDFYTGGEISLPRTHHGESRLPNITKYDLGDNNYRLVFQSINGHDQVGAFLFVGLHADAERWIENHRNYKWLKRSTDQTLEFVLVSSKDQPPPRVDRTSQPEEWTLNRPLLAVVSDDVQQLPYSKEMIEYLLKTSAADMQRDEDGILEHLMRLDDSNASPAFDLLHHAYRLEWKELHAKIEGLRGLAEVVEESELADAMLDEANSERFVSFGDLDVLPRDIRWDKWLLFLSPQQKEFARKKLDGPARLSGVSGSGKTCVLLHRAREMANRHVGKVLAVTSAESMQTLLERLLDDLCPGMIRPNIITRTMVGLARDIIARMTDSQLDNLIELDAASQEEILNRIVIEVQEHPEFDASGLPRTETHALLDFLRDELSYLRSRLRARNYDLYRDPKAFPRRGRGRGLSVEGRAVCVLAAQSWERHLSERGAWDALGLVQFALELVEEDEIGIQERARTDPTVAALLKNRINGSAATITYRSVLVDEVQDLSQLEISLLAAIPTADGTMVSKAKDGLYLVGDGAQAIYKRGFSFRACGIELAGARSFQLKKNYRNTREILKAAFEIIQDFSFADFGDEALQSPISPEFASEHGPRPTIVVCDSIEDEARFVADQVAVLRDSARYLDPELTDATTPDIVIGIIAASAAARSVVAAELGRREMPFGELHTNRPDDRKSIMLSDVESCKGHEFQVVFVVGVQEGAFPRPEVNVDDLPREAARLYVAMTRAKQELFLTHSWTDGAAPSPFLWLARWQCDEGRYLDGQLERNADSQSDPEADRLKWQEWLSRIAKREAEPPISRTLTKEEILAKLAKNEITIEEATRLLEEADRKRGGLYCRVSQKGAISVYGLQRMPVTLYTEQWTRLLDFGDDIREFGKEHDGELKRKDF